jgi:hypothetical protein
LAALTARGDMGMSRMISRIEQLMEAAARGAAQE